MDKQVRTFPKGMAPRIIQAVDTQFEVSEGGDDTFRVEGYGAIYDNWFTVAQWSDMEVQRRNQAGMFARSLSQNPDIVLRRNHQDALARTHAGTLTVSEDDNGLRFAGRVSKATSVGNDVFQDMKNGLYTQGSVQYWPVKLETWEEMKDGKRYQYEDVLEGNINRGDVTITIWGANSEANVNLAQMYQMASRLGGAAPDDAAVNVKLRIDPVSLQEATDAIAGLAPAKQEPDYALLREREVIRVKMKQFSTEPNPPSGEAEGTLERTETPPAQAAEEVAAAQSNDTTLEVEDEHEGNFNA